MNVPAVIGIPFTFVDENGERVSWGSYGHADSKSFLPAFSAFFSTLGSVVVGVERSKYSVSQYQMNSTNCNCLFLIPFFIALSLSLFLYTRKLSPHTLVTRLTFSIIFCKFVHPNCVTFQTLGTILI